MYTVEDTLRKQIREKIFGKKFFYLIKWTRPNDSHQQMFVICCVNHTVALNNDVQCISDLKKRKIIDLLIMVLLEKKT